MIDIRDMRDMRAMRDMRQMREVTQMRKREQEGDSKVSGKRLLTPQKIRKGKQLSCRIFLI